MPRNSPLRLAMAKDRIERKRNSTERHDHEATPCTYDIFTCSRTAVPYTYVLAINLKTLVCAPLDFPNDKNVSHLPIMDIRAIRSNEIVDGRNIFVFVCSLIVT